MWDLLTLVTTYVQDRGMGGDVQLVVSDLDGTLWGDKVVPHPATLAALRELEQRHVPLLIATGRRIGSTRDPLAELGLAPPAVMLNGSVGIELASGRSFHRRNFDTASAIGVLDEFRRVGLDPCCYVDAGAARGDMAHVEVYVSERPGTHPEHLRSLGRSAATADLEEVVRREQVLSFGVIGCEEEPARRIAEMVGHLGAPTMNRAYDLPGLAFTVAPHGVSKWDGVLSYCALAGIDHEKVLAIGDGPNDLELLEHASIALSLTGAHPSAIARADALVAAVDEGGWAELLDWL
jgi:hydroxymethylpyrimidine pyrophosphatase-like HAD family hydrolase